MDSEIPSVDIRVRAKLLWGKKLPALQGTLKDFYCATGIKILQGDSELWGKAILLVQNPKAFPDPDGDHGLKLTGEEEKMLELDREPRKKKPKREGRFPTFEKNDYKKWRHLPWSLWRIIILCALGAATQGWSEAAVNCAQQWFQPAFQKFIDVPHDLHNQVDRQPGIVGLINGAPYLCCVISCWLTPLLNEKLGRRGTIFWSTIFSIASPILQLFAQSWWELFIYRLLMGVAIGPKSATIPIYLAETAPASIRGSLVMFWQVFTALGIMLGSLSGVVLQRMGNASNKDKCPLADPGKLLSWTCSKHWRLMLASPSVLPIFLLLFIYECCESPRWTVAKAHMLRLNDRPKAAKYHCQAAYKALEELSRHRLLAARDMLSHYYLLDEERIDLADRLEVHPKRVWLTHQLVELFGRRRNRRAILASSVCMFAQQFCGVNLIVYYSNYAFAKIQLGTQDPTGGDIISAPLASRFAIDQQALLYTMGFGLINFLFAAPAFFMIDTVGRRTLLLCTFPFLAVSHIITTIAFAVHSTKVGPAIALAGMYLFGVFYSFGEGPIPFVYAAESMPLYCREVSMALVVSLNWLFNWMIAFGSPLMFGRIGPAWTFAFYSIWCVVIWLMILFLVPETRLLKLEEVDFVFDKIKTRKFGGHAWKTLLWQLHQGKKPKRLYENVEGEIRRERNSPNERCQRLPSRAGMSPAGDERVGESPDSGHTLVHAGTA
ncbi:hypothetical protein LTR70_008238 [Exophiala xenobiotica]|uniref:Major facilitator superfamily (MFS) profile domain-containing protein n=1 Tax=Lithohypha guttulata TaxID=1690604 RepID=A0ABR0K2H0_9EURO|nr:hypothetical protein LTR24_007768 [Lithohypha guttulata]KAK5312396.1 hypothetical protein LTR70_008238 [Exophiala xenobiotica]